MSPSLESAKSCVEYALRRICDFESELIAYEKLNPYTEFSEIDASTGEEVHKVRINAPLPRFLGHIAFDVVSHLRAALDQAGYAVAMANGKSGKNSHFPFGDSATEAGSRQNGASKDIPPEIFQVMMSFRPYQGGNNSLWGLNKLGNTNKHQILVAPMNRNGPLQIGRGQLVGPAKILNKWDPIKSELEFARVGPGGSLGALIKWKFEVQLGDGQYTQGQPAVLYLNNVATEIAKILDAIDAEAKRMRLFG